MARSAAIAIYCWQASLFIKKKQQRDVFGAHADLSDKCATRRYPLRQMRDGPVVHRVLQRLGDEQRPRALHRVGARARLHRLDAQQQRLDRAKIALVVVELG